MQMQMQGVDAKARALDFFWSIPAFPNVFCTGSALLRRGLDGGKAWVRRWWPSVRTGAPRLRSDGAKPHRAVFPKPGRPSISWEP